jgi:hypothetical protein
MRLNGFKIKEFVAIFGIALLAGCSADSQDSGGSDGLATGVKLSGSVVDGYVSGATVFADTTGDKKFQSKEAHALTDAEGDFGDQNNKTYCTDKDTKPLLYDTHCLTGSFEKNTEYTFYMQGGTDISTGKEFIGKMTAKATTDSEGNLPVFYITPLTTMTSQMSPQQVADFANDLGVTEDDLKADFTYLDDVAGDPTEINKKLLLAEVAITVQRTVEAVSESVKNEVEANGGDTVAEDDKPDATAIAYQSVVSQVTAAAGSGKSVSTVITDSASTIIDETLAETKTQYETAKGSSIPTGDLNSDTGKNLDEAIKSTVKTTSTAFSNVDTSDLNNVDKINDGLDASMRVSQVASSVAVSKDNAAADIDNLDSQVATLFDEFEKDSTDVDEISEAVGSGTSVDDKFTELATRPKITIDADPVNPTLIGVQGNEFTVLVDDDYVQTVGEEDYARLIFAGDAPDSRSGELIACVTLHEDASSNTNEEFIFRNQTFTGTWSYINDYQMTLTMEVSEVKQAGTLVSKRMEGTGDAREWVFNINVGEEDLGEVGVPYDTTATNFFDTSDATKIAEIQEYGCPLVKKYTTCTAGQIENDKYVQVSGVTGNTYCTDKTVPTGN